MSVNLQKGDKVNLTKENNGLSSILIGLGWDAKKQNKGLFMLRKPHIDCDASALLLQNGRLVSKKDLVYFGNLNHSTDAVIHMGDNLTGTGDGDDEQIIVELNKLPECYDRIVIVVNVYEPVARKQHFGLINNVFIRLVDMNNEKEIYRYELTDDYTEKTSLIFGEFCKTDGEWIFNAIGQGTEDTALNELIKKYM